MTTHNWSFTGYLKSPRIVKLFGLIFKRYSLLLRVASGIRLFFKEFDVQLPWPANRLHHCGNFIFQAFNQRWCRRRLCTHNWAMLLSIYSAPVVFTFIVTYVHCETIVEILWLPSLALMQPKERQIATTRCYFVSDSAPRTTHVKVYCPLCADASLIALFSLLIDI